MVEWIMDFHEGQEAKISNSQAMHSLEMFRIAILFIIITEIISHFIFPLQSLSVLRSTSSSSRQSSETTSEPHLFERAYLRQYDVISQGLLFSSTIVLLKCANDSMLLSYLKPNSSSLLLTPSTPLTPLFGTRIHLVTTGMIGDSNIVRKGTEKSIVDYIKEYDRVPSASFIAHEITARIYAKFRKSIDTRPLICHSYVVDSENRKIFEIDPMGMVQEIDFGVAGRNKDLGVRKLRREYDDNLSVDAAKHISSEILRYQRSEEILRMLLMNESYPMRPTEVVHVLL